jgi:Holliday junction DNA helicase RuvA
MFESIKGILKDKDPHRAVVEAGGIGYRIAIPLSVYTRLPQLDAAVQFYLSQVVREDSNTLYGFLSKEERDLFELLITLSGIGPKTGLAIVGHMEIAVFQRAVASSDIRLLGKIPGIGKKTAERLVIEMRDKFKNIKSGKNSASPLLLEEGLVADALNALLHLGYNPTVAQKAVNAAFEEKKEETDLGRLISAALQKI